MSSRLAPVRRLVLANVTIASAWVLASDLVLARTLGVPQSPFAAGQALKGTAFVAATGALLYALVRHWHLRMDAQAQRYRQLFEANPEPTWVVDRATHRFLAVNDSALQRYGWSREQLSTMTFDDLGSPLSTGRARHRTRARGEIDVELTANALVWNGHEALVALARDVTVERAAARALAQQEAEATAASQRLAAFVEAAPFGIVELAPDGAPRTGNPAAARLLRWDSASGERPLPELVDSQWSALLADAAAGRTPRDIGACAARRNGDLRRRELSLALAAIRGAPGAGLDGILLAIEDVSERRREEARRGQAEKLAAVGQLAGGVAHDFNNLLVAISGFTELAQEACPPDDPRSGYFDEVQRAVGQARRLVAQLLAFANHQVTEASPLDVNAVVEETRGVLGRLVGEDVTIAWRPSARSCVVRGDRSQLEQIVVNLAANARDAMRGGGVLTVATDHVDVDATDARAGRLTPGRYVALAVADTGEGMSPEVVDRAFEPFYSTKTATHGTGLGLATVQRIAVEAGGGVDIDTTPGAGTRIAVLLPAIAVEP